MKLFIILLTCSMTSVLAHPEIKLHSHDATEVAPEVEFTEESHTEAE
tara:strand:+ start:1788 stop:1928 length:141 start_codon:yes stop_codon:yes gene_type:complete